MREKRNVVEMQKNMRQKRKNNKQSTNMIQSSLNVVRMHMLNRILSVGVDQFTLRLNKSNQLNSIDRAANEFIPH